MTPRIFATATALVILLGVSGCQTSVIHQVKDGMSVTETERKVFGIRYFYDEKIKDIPTTQPK